jgi:hypothetical protein
VADVLVTLVGSVALVGFYDVLKDAGPMLVLAPILGVSGLVLVTISHLIPVALAYESYQGMSRPMRPRGPRSR